MAGPSGRRSKAEVCGRSPAEIMGSNPAGGMDVCLLSVLCVVRYRSLRRADPSSRGVLPIVVLRCVWSRKLKTEEAMAHVGPQRQKKNKIKYEIEASLLTIIKMLHSCVSQNSKTQLLRDGENESFVTCKKGKNNGICRNFALNCQTSACVKWKQYSNRIWYKSTQWRQAEKKCPKENKEACGEEFRCSSTHSYPRKSDRASRPDRFILEEKSCIHRSPGGWVGSMASLDALENR
jgi:hypothetical protein